jgi:hypothetical protein
MHGSGAPKAKTPRKRYTKPKAIYLPIPGSYRCVKGPAIAFRFSAAFETRDDMISPVPLDTRIDGCVECKADDGLGALWLQVQIPGVDGLRYLPTVLDGEPLFEQVLEEQVVPKKIYEVPQNQRLYTVFTQLK